jgi:hypothetical protein
MRKLEFEVEVIDEFVEDGRKVRLLSVFVGKRGPGEKCPIHAAELHISEVGEKLENEGSLEVPIYLAYKGRGFRDAVLRILKGMRYDPSAEPDIEIEGVSPGQFYELVSKRLSSRLFERLLAHFQAICEALETYKGTRICLRGNASWEDVVAIIPVKFEKRPEDIEDLKAELTKLLERMDEEGILDLR